ncbi:MAG: DUF6320 domain-containing protein [Oscillospiraceae bacterium]
MPYCVHCGVELEETAMACPLCHTPVMDPGAPVDPNAARPYPTEKMDIEPASRPEVALILSAMFASVALCCGVLNLFLRSDRLWSLYVLGAALMLWVWFVPPLMMKKLPLWLRLTVDALSVGVYVFLISVDLNGMDWFLTLALPIVLLGTGVLLFLGLMLQNGRRSILTGITLIIGAVGVILAGVEFFIDFWIDGVWEPTWSIIIVAVCVALVIPLIVVRRVPNLREEARRRFHI